MKENESFLTEQVITYLGNKRKLLNDIAVEVEKSLDALGKEKGRICDLFSGSGVVARRLKQYSSSLIANDLEKYSQVINHCYLTNKEDFDEEAYMDYLQTVVNAPLIEGVITKNYAPKDDNDIQDNERVFYTHENAMKVDTYRTAIDNIPPEYQRFFLAPLLYEASVHANTSGVFKGFYKSKSTGRGKFGGDGENALDRIMGHIELKKPVFSNFRSDIAIYQQDANILAQYLKDLDVTYIDPPYNQHPYGSNYFMLNTIIENHVGDSISKVSGIPDEWNRSAYNKKNEALKAFEELISNIDSKFIIISYNNEGFISLEEMENMLSKYGKNETKAIDYVAFRGSRNLKNRDIHTKEYIFTVQKN